MTARGPGGAPAEGSLRNAELQTVRTAKTGVNPVKGRRLPTAGCWSGRPRNRSQPAKTKLRHGVCFYSVTCETEKPILPHPYSA